MIRAGIGIVLCFLGMVSIESDALWFPLTCLAIGGALLLWGSRADEKKKKNVKDYTSHDNSRPFYLH